MLQAVKKMSSPIGKSIRAAFFDIDGTLVSLKTRVYPPSARDAIARLRARGIACFVATGRSRFEIQEEHLLDGIAFDGILTNNGQDAYDAEGKLLYGHPIDPQDVRAVLDWVDSNNCACWMVSDRQSLLNHLDARVLAAMESIHTAPPPIGDLRPLLDGPVFKIVLFLTPEEMRAPIACAAHTRATQWFAQGHDLIAKDGGKRTAMLHTLARLGLTAEEAIAFGDSENDLEMLQAAGIGVAMGNATPQIRAAADYITKDCDADGIFHALMHFGLLDEV